MTLPVPTWCEVSRGTGCVLLVAPHGGRRPPVDPLSPPENLRVNDVYTPEVTIDLARRLGATAIVNRALDRNEIDLNRSSQVQRQAPWFLELLDQELLAILARHAKAEIIFVHGWNNGQLKCDIGIGGKEIDGEVSPPAGKVLSVTTEYLATRVQKLRRACADRGICAPLGEKYAASHPNNLVQRYSPNPCAAAAQPEIRSRVNALQLELALPLRCPGPWRDQFLDAVVEAYADRSRTRPRPTSARAGRSNVTSLNGSESMQFYDAGAGIGVFAGVGRTGPKSTGGRLLVFLGGQRIALFTGEEIGGEGGVPPLVLERRRHRVSLRFHGPILAIEDAAEYLDLEAALAASTAAMADVELELDEVARAPGSATLGTVRGTLAIGGRECRIDTQGFSHVAALRSVGAAQTMLAATFGQDAVVGRMPHEGDGCSAVCFRDQVAQSLRDVRLTVTQDGDAYTPARFELCAADEPTLHAAPMSRMAILRSGPSGYVRVAFGVARFVWAGAEGFGLYEHALPLAAARRA